MDRRLWISNTAVTGTLRGRIHKKMILKVYPEEMGRPYFIAMGGSSMVRAGVLYASDLGSIPSRPIIYVDVV